MRTRIKICGLTRAEDVAAAVAAGADALGFVFYPPSSRNLSVEHARTLVSTVPAFVARVGLFVDHPADEVEEIAKAVGLNVLQFHGQETPAYCAEFELPWIKAIRMLPGLNVAGQIAHYGEASGWLLDTFQEGRPGGTGETFDWSMIPAELGPRIVLAGGLEPGNVAEAVAAVRPYGVDVSGGVEVAKGIKDAALINAFIRGVNLVEHE